MGMGSKQFMGETKGGSGDILNWKEEGSIVGFIHPNGFHRRNVYWLQVDKEDEEGEKEPARVAFNCPGIKNGCPICQLREYLKAHEEIEDDEIIYSVGKKKKKVEILKGDALNLKDFDWKLSLLPNKEFLFGFVDVENVEGGIGIIIASAGLGRALSTCINNKMDDDGDEEGDPLKNPWAIKLVYKEKETPANKYKAFFNSTKLTKEIKALLGGAAPNMENLTRPSAPRDIWNAIKGGLSVEGFEPELPKDNEEAEEDDLPKSKRSIRKSVEEEQDDEEEKLSKKKLKKRNRINKADQEDDTEIEVEDEEEEEHISKTKKKKVKKQKEEEEDEPEEESEPCPSCGKNLPLSAEKCEHCGIEFDIVKDSEDSEEGEDVDAETDEEEEEDNKKIKCPYCKEKISAAKKRCPECGEKL